MERDENSGGYRLVLATSGKTFQYQSSTAAYRSSKNKLGELPQGSLVIWQPDKGRVMVYDSQQGSWSQVDASFAEDKEQDLYWHGGKIEGGWTCFNGNTTRLCSLGVSVPVWKPISKLRLETSGALPWLTIFATLTGVLHACSWRLWVIMLSFQLRVETISGTGHGPPLLIVWRVANGQQTGSNVLFTMNDAEGKSGLGERMNFLWEFNGIQSPLAELEHQRAFRNPLGLSQFVREAKQHCGDFKSCLEAL